MTEKKGNVILAPGPLHLFWTTGVYYLWELSRSYRVILIVNRNYVKDSDFKKVIKLADVTEVFYIPDRFIIKKHLYYAYKFKYIVKKYKPLFIFRDNPFYISMMYLYYWSKKIVPSSVMICFLNTMSTIDWKQDFKSVVAYNISLIENKYRLPKWIAELVFKIKNFISLFINYYTLPILFIGRYFYPLMDIPSRRIIKHYWNDNFHFYLLYDEIDRTVLRQYCGSENGFVKIQHPLKTCGKELNRILYNSKETNIVLILPTCGQIYLYQRENKILDVDLIKEISSKWIDAINTIEINYPNFIFFWKLHPGKERDFLWKSITNKVKKTSRINIIPSYENAQKWILKSKVIISDISSVLWWASLLGSKIVISLDIFNIPFMNDLKHRKGVYCFNNLEDFHSVDFNKIKNNTLNKNENIQSLNDFLRNFFTIKKIF